MNFGYLYASVVIALLLLGLVYYRLQYGVVRLTRRWLRLLAQVTSTVLAAQIVGIVFFVSTLQQADDGPANGNYLLNAARNLTYGALISILGLLLMVMFAASVQGRRDNNGWGRASSRAEKLTMACAVVGIAFVGLVHLAFMLPLILLDPLL